MLISEFARATGLSADTIRFYVGKGLLKPGKSAKGGSNPYQVFTQDDVTAARMIRLQQTLGFSLREIGALNREYRIGATSAKRTAQVLQTQIEKLEGRQAEIEAALAFLRGKLKWVQAGKPGKAPQYDC